MGRSGPKSGPKNSICGVAGGARVTGEFESRHPHRLYPEKPIRNII